MHEDPPRSHRVSHGSDIRIWKTGVKTLTDRIVLQISQIAANILCYQHVNPTTHNHGRQRTAVSFKHGVGPGHSLKLFAKR